LKASPHHAPAQFSRPITISLNDQDWQTFVDEMNSREPPNANMVNMVKKYRS
jgi:hypothetical protein